MTRELKKIAFVLEECTVLSAGQQLLDRFLIGYPREESFHRLNDSEITAFLTADLGEADLKRRIQDFDLIRAATVEKAVAEADAIVVAWRGSGMTANEVLLHSILENARLGTPCFVHGVLGNDAEAAQAALALAASRKIALVAGTALGVTWRLPQVDLPLGTALEEAMMVVQGRPSEAEFDGLECLVPVIERRLGGEAGVRRIRCLTGADVWLAGEKGEWSWPLLAAAISRSNSPLGETEKDGRIQDLVGMGLVTKQAKSPRALMIEHADGLRTSVLVLDGVISDYNFAVRPKGGQTISAQIYRPPSPSQQQYSRLAGLVEDFFRTGETPWPTKRGPLIAGLMAASARLLSTPGTWQKTPQLNTPYRLTIESTT